jgi:large subunit ribosomal protein L29
MAKATTEYRELSADALQAKVKELESQLFNNRLQATLGKLENTTGLRTLRRDIARARTVLGEKGRQAA